LRNVFPSVREQREVDTFEHVPLPLHAGGTCMMGW
jgi:hypothetical protein